VLEAAAAVAVAFAITAFLFYPLPFRLGALVYRLDNADAQFSVWNVAWVARALVRDPRHVFDANIFHPERGTLAYSEANLGSGLLAAPVYALTGNQYAAHNFVVLLSFLASAVGTYYLLRYLSRDRLAAAVGALAFAFAPYLFAHLLHIQLLWTAGLPIGLLLFHLLTDRPSPGRGTALGSVVSAQLYFCAYYGVFLVLAIVGFTLWAAVFERRWRDGPLWSALAVAAATAVVMTLPLLLAVLEFQTTTGYTRALAASEPFSANWAAYLASPASAHHWLLELLPPWREILFPGSVAVAFGVVGILSGARARGRLRATTWQYVVLGALACWLSFGPAAGLYRWLYAVFPPLSLMRAPSRFGVVVLLACSVLCAIGVARAREWLTAAARRRRLAPWWPWLAGAALLAAAIIEHDVPLQFSRAPRAAAVYGVLAGLPDGAVLEVPVYSRRAEFLRTRYMLASTIHWKPLVNAYSDYVPPSLSARLDILGGFPSPDSLRELRRDQVRYAVVHLRMLSEAHRRDLEQRLDAYAGSLVLLYEDERTRLFEITPK
jgi:hypothetical protein